MRPSVDVDKSTVQDHELLSAASPAEGVPDSAPNFSSNGLPFAEHPRPIPGLIPLPYGRRDRVKLPEDLSVSSSELLITSASPMAYTTLPCDVGQGQTECLFYAGTKELFKDIPGFPLPQPQPMQPDPAYRIAPAPGKGLGLFSTRALKQGELILSERPLMIVPPGIRLSLPESLSREQRIQYSLDERERVLSGCVQRMSPENRAAFFSLANSHKEDGSGPILGIVRTNGLGLRGLRVDTDDATGCASMYSAVLKDIARLNHSCSANTKPIFDRGSLSYNLYAVRDVADGEELTFHYVDSLAPAVKRQEALAPYDLVCACDACKNSSISDVRRAAIRSFSPSPAVWAANKKLSDKWLVEQCMKQLRLIEKEKVQSRDEYHKVLAGLRDAYICLGDAKSASKWAVRANKCVWAGGASTELEDPAGSAYPSHPLWLTRKNGDLPGFMQALIQQEMATLAVETCVRPSDLPPTGSGLAAMLKTLLFNPL
ncbi:unnamed protein product [Mycena citricolor]|uniref:SET domain-containing protein n=1 Tax=Mycena citricolor TaxID=2018698 RepID=A0AAD2HWX7_9AGAR|nr:unnamed protein product [Mycena citricolor]